MTFTVRRLDGKLALLPTFAAAMAFYFAVSLVPFFIVVSKLVAWLFSANLVPELAVFLRDILPPESHFHPDAISAAVGGPGIGVVSTGIAVWTAGNGLNEMARAVHFIFSDSKRPHPGGWTRRVKSFGLLAVWTLGIAAAAVFLVLIPAALAELSQYAGRSLQGFFGANVRYPLALFLLFAVFTLTYAYVPERRQRPRWQAAAQGGAVAAACWLITCLLFAYLLPRVWGVSLFHGVLSSVLATLVWAYCGCWGILIGACWGAVA